MQLSAHINNYSKYRHRADPFKKVSTYIHVKSSKRAPSLLANWALQKSRIFSV